MTAPDRERSAASRPGRRVQRRRPVKRRRRWQPSRSAVYAGLVVLVGLAIFLLARSGIRSPAPSPAAAPAIVAYQGDAELGGHQSSLDRVIGHGKPVVLNFFAGACAPCSAEMPGFERAYESVGDRALFVGLDVGPFTGMGSHEDAARLLRQLGIRYPAAYAVDDAALRGYDVQSMPTTLFFDARGRLVDRSDGALTESDLQARVQRLLETPTS